MFFWVTERGVRPAICDSGIPIEASVLGAIKSIRVLRATHLINQAALVLVAFVLTWSSRANS